MCNHKFKEKNADSRKAFTDLPAFEDLVSGALLPLLPWPSLDDLASDRLLFWYWQAFHWS